MDIEFFFVSLFLSNTLNISTHFIMTFMFSVEKSAINLVEAPLYMKSYFFLIAFKILSLALAFNSLIMVCLGVNLFVCILLGFRWTPWMGISVFFKISVKFLAIICTSIFSAIFSHPFPDYAFVGTHNAYPHFSESLFIYFHSYYFLFLRLNNLNWPIFIFLISLINF